MRFAKRRYDSDRSARRRGPTRPHQGDPRHHHGHAGVGAARSCVGGYGRLVTGLTANWPRQPVDIATPPVLGPYGGNDDLIPLETVAQMRASLARG